MVLVVKDRIKDTSTTSGTGTITLANSPPNGFQAFSVLGNNSTTYYAIQDANNAFEIGLGTYNANTLTRTTVLASSNSGNLVSLTSPSSLWVDYPASKAYLSEEGIDKSFTATASITAGKPVILNSAGTVTQVAMVSGTESFTFSKGSATALVAADTSVQLTSCFDISAQRFILVYTNSDASNYMYGNVVEVDSSKVVTSRGIDTIISSSNGGETPTIAYDSANEKSMLAYASGPNSNDLRGKVLTATGSGLSVGAEVVINTSNNSASRTKLVYEPTSGKFAVSYKDQSNSSYITAQVGTISGTTSSWGSNTLISAAGTATQIGLGAGNGKVLFLTKDSGNAGDARAGTISGTTFTLGSPVEFDGGYISSPYPSSDSIVCYDTQNDRFFAGYEGPSDNLYGMVFQISGTTVSHGTRNLIKNKGNDFCVPHFSDIGKIPIIYGLTSSGTPANGKYYREATINKANNSITYNSDVTLNTTDTDQTTLAYDSTSVRLLASYHLLNDNIEAYGIIPSGSRAGLQSNLTSTNYLGVASTIAGANASVNINIPGSINNDQTSLNNRKNYYTSGSGVISTTLSSNFVGRAISSTQLLLEEEKGNSLDRFSNGAITKGKPIVMQADGDVAQVASTSTSTSFSQIIGALSTIDTNTSGFKNYSSAHNNNGTFLLAYKDESNNRAYAMLGTYASNGAITFGSTVLVSYPTEQIQDTSCYYDVDNDCFVVIGCTGLDQYVYATIFTYSGTTLTQGSYVQFDPNGANTNGTGYVSAKYDTTNKIGYVACTYYSDSVTVLTVTGSTITAGSRQYILGSYGGNLQYASMDYDSEMFQTAIIRLLLVLQVQVAL